MQLEYWQDALAGNFGPIHENDPQPGYYRTRPGRKALSQPVAIWIEDERVWALRDGLPVEPYEVWTWCCRHPISYETYVAVAENGMPWPDEIVPIGIGHKSAESTLDPAERLGSDIAGLWQDAQAWLDLVGVIAAQGEADRAANYADRFSALEKAAEEARTAEKKPVLEQGRAIDARWKPVVGAAEAAKRAMKKSLEPFLVAEAARLADDGGFGEVSEGARAGTGVRRIGLRRMKRVCVSDHERFIAHYRRDARVFAEEAVQAILLRLAEADLTAGKRVPGATLLEEQVAA